MLSELVRIHHAAYQEDLDFWLSRLEGIDPVLELGCGSGRVALPLLAEGHVVYGLDLDLESLAYAAKAARADALPDPWLIQADMRQIPLAGPFGAVILPCNTYSTLPAAGRIRVLRGASGLLTPQGIFLASVPNPELIRRGHQELSAPGADPAEDQEAAFIHPRTGNPIQVSSTLSPGPDFLSWVWIYDHLLPDGHTERFKIETRHQLSSLEEYQREIEQAGYRSCSFLGDFDGSPHSQDSPYLILVCGRS